MVSLIYHAFHLSVSREVAIFCATCKTLYNFANTKLLLSFRPAEASSRSCALTCDHVFAAKNVRIVDIYESGVWWLAESGAYHAGPALIP